MENPLDPLQRRKFLETEANPNTRLDYVSTLDGSIQVGEDGNTIVTVRYVPDKQILQPKAFITYLGVLNSIDWPSIEESAATILDDLNNEVIPRWVQVTLEHSTPGDDGGLRSHRVMLEDRQPRWDNPTLLSRLKLI
ncbi:MAG: hypothetical protein OQJ87_01365 [Rhodospirillales bacterium]|nr:hypothetical protein [Rhodospirillales bacterium]